MKSSSPEMSRILDLPVRDGAPPPGPRTRPLLNRLWPIQAEILAELEAAPPPRGVIASVGAGHGKTRPSVLAGYVLDIKEWILIVPATLVGKTNRDIAALVPLFPEMRDYLPKVVSAELISSVKRSNLLNKLAPKLIVIDEAHTFANPTAARSKRLLNYMIHNPDTRLVAMSGTLDQGDIERIEMIAELVFREGSFLPLDRGALKRWGSVLNEGSEPADTDVQLVTPLLEWAAAQAEPPATFGSVQDRLRWAYKIRRITTPGYVATSDSVVKTGLEIVYWKPPAPMSIQTALGVLRDKWELPDGSQIVDALEYHRHASTLAMGFYATIDYGEQPEEWLEARREWSRAVNRQINYIRGYPNLDSPARVARAAECGIAHPDVNKAYEAWAAVRDSVEPSRAVTWLDTSVVEAAARYVQEQGRGILWYSSKAVEAQLRRFMPTFGAGTQEPPSNVPVFAASIRSHGTGKNLQAWDWQLVLEPPSNALTWEQLIARTHREGQRSDTVSVEIAAHAWPLRARIYAALRSAKHAETVGTQRQRLLLATWR